MKIFVRDASAKHIGVYFTAVFSGAYLTKLGLSPIYPLMGFGIALLFCLMLTGKVRSSIFFWCLFLSSLGIFAAFALYQNMVGSLLQNSVNFMLGPIGFVLIAGAGRGLSVARLGTAAKGLIYCTILLAAIECVYRLSHPDFGFLEGAEERNVAIEDVAFYAYKFSSLMYLDSNFVGLQLAVTVAFCLALTAYNVRFHWAIYLVLLVLVALTLSRASVIATAAVFAIYAYPRLPRFLKVIGFISGLVIVELLFFRIRADGSFLTKLDLLSQFQAYLSAARPTAIAFGVGVGNASKVLGMGAHNLLVTYVVEIGSILSIMVLAFWLLLSKSTEGVFLLVTAWLVNGFSLTSFAMPYMYCAAAILLCMSRARNIGETCDGDREIN